MLIGALLVVTWVILLIRYPLRAAPISLGALLGLGLVAAWVIWQEQRGEQLLAQLELRMAYAPSDCPAGHPLHITLENHSTKPLRSLRWEVAAYSSGSNLNLVTSNYDSPQYRGPGDLQPGQRWNSCAPLPPLRSGYRSGNLEFRAERLQGQFAD
ncbi:multidrug transporter [Stutzerimonas zhaodongensis]|uniref:Multidrug transporter n=1 Tax=Stutzerimonas zhaodongensis TaxID=1176257 RepID=A0A3M2HP59_9GAMM|nr:multidrug transporter [Stutzerimonas zhaodongensis]MCQ4318451.1 multidrug transporter [Stutzerimonas zhaodongensis]RMH87524.1 multidrug transporter [Stutzerimonas zhaodongensis]